MTKILVIAGVGRKKMKILLLLVLTCVSLVIAHEHDAILFRNIPNLVLHRGYFTPEVIHCSNIGVNDKGEVQWKCEAQMEDLYRLGRTTVSCEGYNRAGDPLVLKGSCGVEYTLHLTQKGKDRYLRPPAPAPVRVQHVHHHEPVKTADNETGSVIIAVVMIAGICFVIFCIGSCVYAAANSPTIVRPRRSPSPVRPVYVEPQHNTSNDFFEGYVMGSAMVSSSNPPVRERHHHTTTVINNNNNNVASQPAKKKKKKVKTSSTYTSTGYGGSVSRGSDDSSWSWSISSSHDNDDNNNTRSSSSSSSSDTHTSTGYGGSSSR